MAALRLMSHYRCPFLHTLLLSILLIHLLAVIELAQVAVNQAKPLFGPRSYFVRLSFGTFGTARYGFLLEMAQFRVPVHEHRCNLDRGNRGPSALENFIRVFLSCLSQVIRITAHCPGQSFRWVLRLVCLWRECHKSLFPHYSG